MSLFFRQLTSEDVFGSPSGPAPSWTDGRGGVLGVAPVYSAVSLIADQFASLPMSAHKGGTKTSTPIELPDFLAEPDSRVSPFDWRYQLATSLKLRGNAYGYIDTVAGRPKGIVWIHPDSMSVDESGHFPIYRWGSHSELSWRQGGKVVHIREFVQPGSVVGLSPIKQHMAYFDTARLASEFGRSWFKHSSMPAAILSTKARLKPGQAKEAVDMFMESTGQRKPVVLDGEWDWQKVSITPEEAQFLATIKASATVIASIFRVAPEDIGGESGNSRTYSNREMDQEVFNIRTLLPLVKRVEEALSLLLPATQFIKFNMDALNRPSLLDRSRAYTENLKNGTITLAEVRELENRPELTPQDIDNWLAWYANLRSEPTGNAELLAATEGLKK